MLGSARQEAWLAAQDDDDYEEPETEWAPEWSPGLSPVEALEAEHEASVGQPWASAQAAVAAEDAEFSDSTEDGYVEDGFEEGDDL